MATIKFEVLTKSINSSIYLRLSIKRGLTPRAKTGLYIDSKNWSVKTGFPKQTSASNKNLNYQLQSLKAYILKRLNESNSEGEEISKYWLEHKINVFFKRDNENKISEYLQDCIDDIIKNARTRKNSKGGIGLSKSRINSYETLKTVLKEFKPKRNIKAKEINIEFANNLLSYLIDDRKYSESYAIKKIADLKTVCYEASTKGIEISPQLRKISSAKPKGVIPPYLNEEELESIKNLELQNKSLNNAKKWLLLGCNIGQRGGDLLAISQDNIKTINDLNVIQLTQKKTDKNVTIPILKTTQEILKDGLPYKISLQKFNTYIKEICKLAGIDEKIESSKVAIIKKEEGKIEKRKLKGKFPKYELISSHVCRRSFATNLYGVLPTPLIMQITAHSTEKMLLNYIGKSSVDYAKQIAEFFKNQENFKY